MLAFEFDFVQYFEKNPNDKLALATPRLLYRWPSEYFELDFGMGATVMHGNQTQVGFNVSGAAQCFPIKNMIIETKIGGSGFEQNKRIGDFDISAAYKYRMIGLKAGYRIIWTEGSQSLHGPHVGLLLQW